MPNRCSVSGCRSNYDKEKERVTAFSLPRNDSLRSQWIRKIPTDLKHLKCPYVCIKHFHESMIIKVDKVIVNGEWKEFPRKIPKLVENAVPTIFHNLPSYLTSIPSTPKRLVNVEEQNFELAIKESLEEHRKYQAKNSIKELQDIVNYLCKKFVKTKWVYLESNDNIVLCLMDTKSIYPSVLSCIKIESSLEFSVLINKVKVKHCDIPHKCKRIDKFNCLDDVIEYVENMSCNVEKIDCLENVIDMLKSSSLYEDSDKVQFIVEQLILFAKTKNNRRYVNRTMVFASALYTYSPAAYYSLLKLDFLCLPHPRNLQKLIARMSLSNFDLKGSTLYLKTRLKHLESHEFLVNILLDEVYIDSRLSMKGGSIYGSTNENGLAKTALVFMITSILSNYKDVISIVPVNNITSDNLKSLIMSVLTEVEALGFKVISLISDNNVVNRKAFELFSQQGVLQPCINHPLDPDRKLFLIFDTVHILKCVRNNWIRKSTQRFLSYPDFDNYSLTKTAEFRHLELMYDLEKNSFVKYGHLLSIKALYPSTVQKQNVKLALQIINEKNVIALQHIARDHPLTFGTVDGTCDFLSIFIKWWKVVNVKSAFEGARFNDPSREAIRKGPNASIDFLKKMSLWLQVWRQSSKSSDMLTSQTFASLKNTVDAFIMLSDYMFDNFNIDYLLFGKFQSDDLESRFSMYRRLSGCNYYVSFVDIIASERKIRFKNLVLLSSEKLDVTLKTLMVENEEVQPTYLSDVTMFSELIEIPCLDIENIPQNILKILTYIGGFVSKREIQKRNCVICAAWLHLPDKTVQLDENYDFVNDMDRGNLTLPTEFVINAVSIVWNMSQLLVQKYLNVFLRIQNQLYILHTLGCIHLKRQKIFSDESCLCGEKLVSKVEKVMFRACKIFLGNIMKAINEQKLGHNKDNQRSIIKLQKLNG